MGVDEDRFQIRFWGVRGTVPCPGAETLRYGGNTACLEVVCGNERLIFDAGTGLRVMGYTHPGADEPWRSHIFFTHTHLDHILGLPFFKPAYEIENTFQLWCGHLGCQERKLRTVLKDIMNAPYFPVPLKIMRACMAFHDFTAGEGFEPLAGIRIRTVPLTHPGGATGYRVDYAGRSFCYITDHEHGVPEVDERLADFIADSELMVYDATYTDEEYPRFKAWGHSTWQVGARLCTENRVRRLATFHHDPKRSDTELDRIQLELEAVLPGSFVARESMVIDL